MSQYLPLTVQHLACRGTFDVVILTAEPLLLRGPDVAGVVARLYAAVVVHHRKQGVSTGMEAITMYNYNALETKIVEHIFILINCTSNGLLAKPSIIYLPACKLTWIIVILIILITF